MDRRGARARQRLANLKFAPPLLRGDEGETEGFVELGLCRSGDPVRALKEPVFVQAQTLGARQAPQREVVGATSREIEKRTSKGFGRDRAEVEINTLAQSCSDTRGASAVDIDQVRPLA